MQDVQVQPRRSKALIWNYSFIGLVSFALNLLYFAFETVIRNLITNLVMPLALRLGAPFLYVAGVAEIAMLPLIPSLLFVLVYLIGGGFNAARINYTSLSPVLLATGTLGAEIGWWIQYFLLFQYSADLCNVPFCPLSPVLSDANTALIILAVPAGIYTLFVGLSAVAIAQSRRARRLKDTAPSSVE